MDMELVQLISKTVSAGDNAMLLALFTLEEVKMAVMSTPLDAAPRADGFSVAFFTSS